MSISNYDFDRLRVGDTVFEKGTRTAVVIREIYNENGTRGIIPQPGAHVISWLPQANIAAILAPAYAAAPAAAPAAAAAAAASNDPVEIHEITLSSGKIVEVIPIRYVKKTDRYYGDPPPKVYEHHLVKHYRGIPMLNKVYVIGSKPQRTGRVVSVYSPPRAEQDPTQYMYGVNFNEHNGLPLTNEPSGFYTSDQLAVGTAGGRRRKSRKSRKSKKARKTRRRH